MALTKYDTDLIGKTPAEVGDLIAKWRYDDDAMGGAACDLLNSIEPWVRSLEADDIDPDLAEGKKIKEEATEFLRVNSEAA